MCLNLGDERKIRPEICPIRFGSQSLLGTCKRALSVGGWEQKLDLPLAETDRYSLNPIYFPTEHIAEFQFPMSLRAQRGRVTEGWPQAVGGNGILSLLT